MSCHLISIELFYFDDYIRRIVLWVSAFSLLLREKRGEKGEQKTEEDKRRAPTFVGGGGGAVRAPGEASGGGPTCEGW